jgi:hypothetical protein
MVSVLVTGTSKGIGMATVLVLGRAGHTVYATIRDPGRSPELAQTAENEGLPIHVSVMDVDSDTSVAEAISGIEAEHGPRDGLVNNAGIERRGDRTPSPSRARVPQRTAALWPRQGRQPGLGRRALGLLPGGADSNAMSAAEGSQRRWGCLLGAMSAAEEMSTAKGEPERKEALA